MGVTGKVGIALTVTGTENKGETDCKSRNRHEFQRPFISVLDIELVSFLNF